MCIEINLIKIHIEQLSASTKCPFRKDIYSIILPNGNHMSKELLPAYK